MRGREVVIISSVFLLFSFSFLWAQDETIEIEEIKKTDYVDEEFEADRSTPYLDQEINKQTNKDYQTEFIVDLTQKEFIKQEALGREFLIGGEVGGHFYRLYFENKNFSDFDFWSINFNGYYRHENLSLSSGFPSIVNSRSGGGEIHYQLTKDLNKHHLNVKGEFESTGLQRFSDTNTQAQRLGVQVDYRGLFNFEKLSLENNSLLYYGFYSYDSASDAINHFVGGKQEVDLIFKGKEHKISDFVSAIHMGYQFNQSFNYTVYRHLLDITYRLKINLPDEWQLNLLLGSMVNFEKKLDDDSSLNLFNPTYVMPGLIASKRWSPDKVVIDLEFGGVLDYQFQSYYQFYEENLTALITELPQMHYLSEAFVDLGIKFDWFKLNSKAFFDYFFSYDQIILSANQHKKIAKKNNTWAFGFKNSIDIELLEEIIFLNFSIIYQIPESTGMLTKIENQNELKFSLAPIYSDLIFAYRITRQDLLWDENDSLKLHQIEKAISVNQDAFDITYALNLPMNITIKLIYRNIANNNNYEHGNLILAEKRNVYLNLEYRF